MIIKFLYGKYYKNCINREPIIITKDIPGNYVDFDMNLLISKKDNKDELTKYIGEKIKYYNYWSHTFSVEHLVANFLYYSDGISFSKNNILRINLTDTQGVYPNNEFYLGQARWTNLNYDTYKCALPHITWQAYLSPTYPSTLGYKNIDDKIPFREKTDKLIFRGGANGDPSFPKRDYNTTTRYKIVSEYYEKFKEIDVGFNKVDNCFPYDTTDCQWNTIYNKYKKNSMTLNEIYSNKFVLSIGGYCLSTSFPETLALANCVAFHTYPFDFEDYNFSSGLKPFIHFIPIKVDGSDLKEKYDWCMDNLDKCEEIIKNAKKYCSFFSNHDNFTKISKRFWELYPIVKYDKDI